MSKRLKSGSGNHRLEICGPSNGRHKIAEDRPDFFALLRSLPSVIDDALDSLYEPNAVFSQFLGSASLTFFSLLFSLLSLLVLSFLAFLVFSFLSFPFSFFAFFSFLFFPFSCYIFVISLFLFSNWLASDVRVRSDRYYV